MPPTPPEDQEERAPSRIGCALLLGFLLCVPLIALSGLFAVSWSNRVVDGAQPGGALRGRAVDLERQPIAGALVSLYLIAIDKDGLAFASSDDPVQQVETDTAGHFELIAPSHEGFYRLQADADLWITTGESVSFLNSEGEVEEHASVELTMRPGCLLRVKIVGEVGQPLGGGTYAMRCQADPKVHMGPPALGRSLHGTIRAGLLEQGGLVPGAVELTVTMDDGSTAELSCTVAPGIVNQRITL